MDVIKAKIIQNRITVKILSNINTGGGGAVESVNGQTGDVELDYQDVGAEAANANIQGHISATGNPHNTQVDGTTLTGDGMEASPFKISDEYVNLIYAGLA